MNIRLAGSEAHLEGCWTHPAVLNNISSLDNTLQLVESAGYRNLRINCEQIEDVDIKSLELLFIWIHCARFRGLKPVLTNVPARLRLVMQRLIRLSFPDSRADLQSVAAY